jgi:nicotinamide-nucleotide amidase
MKAAVVTIGSEITSGEIVNSNSAWIAQNLEMLGVDIYSHLSMQDEESDIIQHLQFVSKKSQLMVVTGGLGPTKDDLTRNVVSQWADRPLQWNEESFQKLSSILQARGLNVTEGHRQQCFFPKGCQLIENTVGTADGFYLNLKDHHLFVLPGPPRELKPMWQSSVVPIIESLEIEKNHELKIWKCLGRAESDLAQVVEPIVETLGLLTGYRPTMPYVTVKVWFPTDITSDHQLVIDELDRQLGPFLVARDHSDPLDALSPHLLGMESLRVEDRATDGIVAHRLIDLISRHSFAQNKEAVPGLHVVTGPMVVEASEALMPTLILERLSDENWSVEYRDKDFQFQKSLATPYKLRKGHPIYPRYISEKSLYEWSEFLGENKGNE